MLRFNSTSRKLALAACVAGAVPAVAAAATFNLPATAPVPQQRPAIEQQTSAIVEREVVAISTTAQNIPEARQHVRVVGTRFLPPRDESINFDAVASERISGIGYAEWLLVTAVNRLFETQEEEKGVQFAAVDEELGAAD